MRRIKTVLFTMAALVSLYSLSFAVHAPSRGSSGDMMKADALRFAEELNLSSGQIKKLEDLKDSSKRKVSDLRHEIRKYRWDIQDELKSKNPDKEKISKAIDGIAKNQKKLMEIRVNQALGVKKILTDEQFIKLTAAMEHGKRKFRDKSKKNFFDRFRK